MARNVERVRAGERRQVVPYGGVVGMVPRWPSKQTGQWPSGKPSGPISLYWRGFLQAATIFGGAAETWQPGWYGAQAAKMATLCVQGRVGSVTDSIGTDR